MHTNGGHSASDSKSVKSIIKKASEPKKLAIVILFLLIGSYVLFFSVLSIDRHNRFDSHAYDLAILDQQIWHHSQFLTPFNTVRGMHIFGDHFTPINMFISPIYWFFDDVRALLVFQTILLALAAIPLFLIAKHYFKDNWIPLIFCFSYLLFPGLHWSNLEDFHVEAFMPLFFLLMFYFLIKGKKVAFTILFLLSLLVKEDVAASTFLLGVYIYFKHDKKLGVFTSVLSLIWFFLVIYAIIPYFSGGGYISMGRIVGGHGEGAFDMLLSLLNPLILFTTLFTKMNAVYIWELLSPVAFIALLNPLTLIMSASLWVNLTVAWPYAHKIQYHYVLAVVPFIFFSVVLSVAKFKNKKIFLRILLSLLIVSALFSNYFLSPAVSSIRNPSLVADKFINFGTPNDDDAQIYSMIELIPENASVSAFLFIVPHLAHRNKIYIFPNPFKTHYWGMPDQEYPPTVPPEYLLIKKDRSEENNSSLQLYISKYDKINETDRFELFELKK